MKWLIAGLVLTLAGCKTTPPPPAEATNPTAGVAPTAAPKSDPAPAAPTATTRWWEDAVFYEIFVRSFRDSDGDGVGDLQGIIDKLDYLNDGDPETGDDLAIDGLWLMPVNPSPSYHGYDVTDYRDINADYGGMEKFEALIAAAHARGIRVITDFVLNHSSREHPWFLSARQGADAPKRDWYTWHAAPPPPWQRPWGGGVWHQARDSYYFGLFWEGMPDLNLANPEVEREMLDTMRFWLGDKRVDGFRIDAIRHLFETADGKLVDAPVTLTFVKRLRDTIGTEFPDALLLGEIWSNAEDQSLYYAGGEGLNMAFSFDMAGKIIEGVKDGVRSEVNSVLERSVSAFPDRAFEAPFLTNHDMPRVMRQLGGDAAKMRLAAALLLASPGTPFIYYGEEIGMVGGEGRADENKRTPMRWTSDATVGFTTGTPWYAIPPEQPNTDVASQSQDRASLLTHYKRLIRARKGSEALLRGDQRRIEVDFGKGGVAFVRATEGDRVLVVVNLDGEAVGPFIVPVRGTPKVLAQEGLVGAPVVEGDGLRVPGLGPRSFAWIDLDQP